MVETTYPCSLLLPLNYWKITNDIFLGYKDFFEGKYFFCTFFLVFLFSFVIFWGFGICTLGCGIFFYFRAHAS